MGIIATLFVCIVQRFVSSKRPRSKDSAPFEAWRWRNSGMGDRSIMKSCAVSGTKRRHESLRMRSSMIFCMEKILERYERYSYAERALFSNEDDPQVDWRLQYNKMKARVESLHKSQRHLMGEQLDSLSIKEIQHLEQHLECSLKNIRSRKTQLMLDSISELQKKEKLLLEQNKTLEIMAKEKAKALLQNAPWEQQNQSQTFQASANEEEFPQPQLRLGNTLLPPWMLGHLNG